MRRYLRTLFLTLVASLFAVSCVNEMELSEPITDPDVVATLVPHVNNFANQYVTKAGYSDAEKKISSLSLYIFNNDGFLVHHTETLDPAATSITLKKSMMNTPTHRGKLNNATVLMMANMSLSDLKKTDGTVLSAEGLTLSVLQNAYLHIPAAKTVITSLGEGFTGFPMMGQITMDLTATTAQQAAVALPLQILYAKVNFSISVVSGGENEDITPNDGKSIGFNLSGYSVHNVATVTPLATPAENGATPSTVYAYTTSGAAGNASGNVTLDGSALPFTFYVAETRYNPTSDLSGIYPDNGWIGNAAYDYLKQQYKPQVAAKATGVPATGLASYVTLNGIYTDYRGSQWMVNYKIYLGKDNMTNFQVDRNSEYTNYITIKGIRNSGGSGTGNVWIDHRVDASINGDDDASDHVKITRETLLDSHFEVRPLRVQWDEDADGNAEYTGVRLYLPTDREGNLLDWIGVEKFTGKNCVGEAIYCYQGGKSTGKRKYFTNELIPELQSLDGDNGVKGSPGSQYIELSNNDCAWIYFDEYTQTTERTADIIIEFYKGEDKITEVYKVRQKGLQTIGGYSIESYEEYLHSYDSADKYNLSTGPVDYTQQGLSWGFEGVYLSQQYIVSALDLFDVKLGSLHALDYAKYYDYYHREDQAKTDYQYTGSKGAWERANTWGTGIDFTHRSVSNHKIPVQDMGTLPQNAYQYCLSKNKFVLDEQGNVAMDVHWYLPDGYELQTILSGATSSGDLNSGFNYWSSQPTRKMINFTTGINGLDNLIQSLIQGASENISVVEEDPENARSVSSTGFSNQTRSTKNRIRCVYSSTGKSISDMNDRSPDGIGGNYSFWMKAYSDKQKTARGFFSPLLPEPTQVKETGNFTNADSYNLKYPTDTDHDGFTYTEIDIKYDDDGDGIYEREGNVSGFDGNPLEKSNWQPEERWVITQNRTYYGLLGSYGGLSPYELDQYRSDNLWAEESDKPKTRSGNVTVADKKVVNQNLAGADNLGTLDQQLGSDMFLISFAKGENTSKEPVFAFEEYVSGTHQYYEKHWNVPTYEPTIYTLKGEDDKNEPVNVSKSYEDYEYKSGSNSEAYLKDAKEAAREKTFYHKILGVEKGAYILAKDALQTGLSEKISDYSADGWSQKGEVVYDPGIAMSLKWNDTTIALSDGTYVIQYTKNGGKLSGYGKWYSPYTWTYTTTCTVKLRASILFEKLATKELYHLTSDGYWDLEGSRVESEDKPVTPEIKKDELRIYSGNSFTISLNEVYQPEYEITKIKVFYSLSNNFDGVSARFVASDGAGKMTYVENSDSGTQELLTDDKSSVTLVLNEFSSGTYNSAPNKPDRYIVIDKIELRARKRTKNQ